MHSIPLNKVLILFPIKSSTVIKKWVLSWIFSTNSLGIFIKRFILFVGIFILTNWFLESSSSFIKAAKLRLKLLIKGNGCEGSTTNGVNNGKIDEVK